MSRHVTANSLLPQRRPRRIRDCADATTDRNLQRLIGVRASLGDTTRQALIDRAQADPTTIATELQRLLNAWPKLCAGKRRIIYTMMSGTECRAQRKGAL